VPSESFRSHQRVLDPKIMIRGDWAFEIANVDSTFSPLGGGEARCVVTATIVAMRKQPGATWKVARVVGLVD